jgi:hypothetical protein
MPANQTQKSLLSAILIAGIIAGIADGLAAIINFYISTGRGPAIIFKFIASAVFGTSAFSGGSAMIVWGVLFHLMIAMIFTALFFLLYPRVSLLRGNKFLVAIGYGLFVWAVMNLLVVPASAAPVQPLQLKNSIIQAIILICCIGLPASLLANKYYRRNTTKAYS